MDWLSQLNGKIIGLDTSPLIYFIEEHPDYIETVSNFFRAMDRGDITVVTSTVTLMEVMVHPIRQNNASLAAEYRDILLCSTINTQEVNSSIAEQAARLRAYNNLRAADAIQIATAMYAGAAYFLTNDNRLPQLASLKMLFLEDIARP